MSFLIAFECIYKSHSSHTWSVFWQKRSNADIPNYCTNIPYEVYVRNSVQILGFEEIPNFGGCEENKIVLLIKTFSHVDKARIR